MAPILTVEELCGEVTSGAIDTVVVAFTDMQGRLMGKCLHAEFFMHELDAGHGVEGCNYLLALAGAAIAALEGGTMARGAFGDQVTITSTTRARSRACTTRSLPTGSESATTRG